MPERTRNISVRLDNWRSDAAGLVAKAMPQVNTRTTVVRTAVARLESTPATPILASTAVIPAKKADSKAHVIQFMGESLLDGAGAVNPPRLAVHGVDAALSILLLWFEPESAGKRMKSDQQAERLFKLWVDACNHRREALLRDFKNSPLFTAHVLTDEDSVIGAVARGMGLEWYCGYYCIDAILFKKEDLVPGSPPNTTWVRRIRVAFEHENYFNSGLFQEVSHLLITDCDLRVLVSYPESESDLDYQKRYLHEIINGTDRSKQISEAASFLFIVEAGTPDTFAWDAYLFRSDDWQSLPL